MGNLTIDQWPFFSKRLAQGRTDYGRRGSSSSLNAHHPIHWTKRWIAAGFGMVTVEVGDFIVINSDGQLIWYLRLKLWYRCFSDLSLKSGKTSIVLRIMSPWFDNITVVLDSLIGGGYGMIQIGKNFAGRYKIIRQIGRGWKAHENELRLAVPSCHGSI